MSSKEGVVIRRLCLAMVLLVLATVALAQKIETDWVRGTDFSAFRTYAWGISPSPVQDVEVDRQMRGFINEELRGAGLQEEIPPDGQFDLIVIYSARTYQDPSDMKKNNVRLQIALLDARDHKVLWRASATEPITGDVRENPAVYQRVIRAMFGQYPPRP